MPFRRLPDSDPTRIAALDAIATKALGVAPVDLPYPAALHSQLEALRPRFKLEAGQAAVALSQQTVATTGANLDFLALETIVSHFIQVFNLGVVRGKYLREHRAHYKLDASASIVPPLTSQAVVVTWAQDLVAGDAARLTAGGAAMANPTAAEIQTALAAYTASGRTQSDAKDDLADEQGDVAALRPDVDELIVDLWDEIEHTHRKLDGPRRRRQCREWGIVYVNRLGETPDPTDPVTPAITTPTTP